MEHHEALHRQVQGLHVHAVRVQRTAHTSHRPVETNLITAATDRFELRYELPAD